MRDASGSTAALAIHLKISSTIADIDASASALASIILSITGAVLVRTRVQYRAVNDTPTPAAEGSSIKRCGVFIFDDDTALMQKLIAVPGLLDSTLQSVEPGAGVLIDLTNADISSWLSAIGAAGTVNPFDVICETLIAAYRQSRV
jgi:hypothetical protein